MPIAIHNKKEDAYTISIPFYMWLDEMTPDYFEPIMSEYTWVMDEFNLHFFNLPEEITSSLSKLAIEYSLQSK
jgi:hypothetical protein